MYRLTQANYSAPTEAGALDEHPLILHQRSEPTKNRGLVIFVHGLGGCRYGSGSTWGHFPQFLYEDFAELDIGLYQYRTLTGRLRFWKSVSLEDEARVLAGILRDELTSYARIVLVGHSMGGLLCKASICELLETKEDGALERVAGLFLLATPQLGSLRVPRFMKVFSADFRALAAHGGLVTKINQKFEDCIALDERTVTYRKVTVPTWAVEGVSDQWVDKLSAGIGLVSARRKVVRGSHTSIVKPRSKDNDVYAWVKQKVRICLGRFKYDVFVAAAMAGNKDDADYSESRKEVLSLIEILKDECGFSSVFYAGMTMPEQRDFDPKTLALQDDLEALRQSRYFILYYPKKVATSALYEAGWALVLGKPSIYLVRDDKNLPFLLGNANQAFSPPLVRILECPDHESTAETMRAHGPRLFMFSSRVG